MSAESRALIADFLPRIEQMEGVGERSWANSGRRIVGALTAALDENDRLRAIISELKTAATVPFPGGSTDSDFMRAAADRLEGRFEVGGSNVRAAVVRVLRIVAKAVQS